MIGKLSISSDKRHFTQDGKRFFMLGDTAWLMIHRLSREEIIHYFNDRQSKGFNTVLITLIHGSDCNIYGKKAFDGELFVSPCADEPDGYWKHVDFAVAEAAARGLYCGLLPAWGSIYASGGSLHPGNGPGYAKFLADRYRTPSVFWVLGGDVRGIHTELWDSMGAVFLENSPDQLITYHPFGRTDSSKWFHDRDWLHFNCYQSGHRRYDQAAVKGSNENETSPDWFAEDNWRYTQTDRALLPVKPTLDAEPSYEDIPQGLLDDSQPYWTTHDVRRFAWWSVLAGAAGHVYGQNSVMQFLKPGYKPAFNADRMWEEGLQSPGSAQMRHVKELMESLPIGAPAQELVPDNGIKHHRVSAYSGEGYAVFYSFLGEPFRVDGAWGSGLWINPETGERGAEFTPGGVMSPPEAGRDWVLLLNR